MVIGFSIVVIVALCMVLSFTYAMGKQRGRWQARRLIEQGLQSGKVSLYGSTYYVKAVEFPEPCRREDHDER